MTQPQSLTGMTVRRDKLTERLTLTVIFFFTLSSQQFLHDQWPNQLCCDTIRRSNAVSQKTEFRLAFYTAVHNSFTRSFSMHGRCKFCLG